MVALEDKDVGFHATTSTLPVVIYATSDASHGRLNAIELAHSGICTGDFRGHVFLATESICSSDAEKGEL